MKARWNYKATSKKGGQIVGSCRTPKELATIRITRQDVPVMIPIETMQKIINRPAMPQHQRLKQRT